MKPRPRHLLIISGLSGAGKTIALNTLEDLGLYCIDNLPVSLLNEFARQISDGSIQATPEIAIGIDARSAESDIKKLPGIINRLKKKNLKIDLVFIDASDDVLTRRFSETRRKHPLSSKTLALSGAIKKERRIMDDLSAQADIRIDTSHTLMHELRDMVRKRIANRPIAALSLQLVSFGYKHGSPRDADFVFDARCLPNPYWKNNLRNLTGKDTAVIKFLGKQKLVAEMIEHIKKFLSFWIPKFEADNRSYLCVAVGCTGGHHRSVYITERLAEYFQEQGKHVITIHRDI
ncbi:MAG: RNase adaptor protein RapZ [Gammaproteobacteria bacterium RIFCSPLOWO2_02_FULL_47_50]|nr:MAG: RNase adaptor protein RapZ [Gammaproteobacteria bacterium RIFCSPLOWO2_01_FULL_47_190]OGT75514.1 MAG: RNase adaptor protein RapZ [Gammaproteobacteria bacterium RIFCSPLOWO2_12_47_11]OGT79110.1 MAG: RNase adaptor protein RapZ [Gammaproteobacteria bacterium RIFCSPLOWO2_02_FULL_47_50]OGT83971.1 MAG: RNase adaptor protein RapZ [Gammaproteobacteria bacterium RIFCSPLOWO2_12_FULL_47_76]